MATILLSAAGAALGSSIGGSVLGLSMTAVGRFIGASVGRSIDQRLMGQGGDAIETGRLERFRLTGAGEGSPVAQVFGRMRLGGHVIWATEFEEHVKKSGGGGKGAPAQPEVKSYSYSVSLALALCEGEITSVGRIWADGAEVPIGDLNMRVYTGSRTQQPDPRIEAVEGPGVVPAYRGTAYVVIEDLDLARFGNRVPQFSFEVTRPEQTATDEVPFNIRGVALMPGTGEYALATTPVAIEYGGDSSALANVNSPSEEPDFVTSLRALRDEVPNCGAASLIVSWFGNDLRCGSCEIRPKVEQSEYDGKKMPWRVCGETRETAGVVPLDGDRPVYGGTPTDQSVVQSIRKMTADGLAVMFYPFILMEQMPGNTLPDPWSDADYQPALPWRGRITLSKAPGRDGSPDKSAAADAEVAAFFGTVVASDFAIDGDNVVYAGPGEFSYSRFILHQAALCAAAGGVDSFCIGSEMRALTQIRGAAGFSAVAHLRALAAECRTLLGPTVKLGYAADWSEYFGYHPQDGSGDVFFNLDPLWNDAEIDFIGIDNYMPLSDWRDGDDHADVGYGTIYDADYLKSNVAGGEGYDWFYPSTEARAAQRREPITDGAHGEPWVFRYKDIRNWWSERHFERINGVRSDLPTSWVPQSKPVWFTELGCAAIDKGTNQPNKFLDPKSSESQLPHFSNGLRDELIQNRYLHAMYGYWGDAANNPVSEEYGAPMIDMSRAFVWAWDARPYPWFPGNEAVWSDGPNYRRGHWINGRVSGRTLASVVAEICESSGLLSYDVSRLHGFVRGYVVPQVSDGRRALQPLMLAHGFDAIERDGALVFRMRDGTSATALSPENLAVSDEIDGDIEETRAAESEMAGRVRLRFVLSDADHQNASEETVLPDETTHAVAETELALSLTRAEGRATLERWLSEARIARDSLRFALPLSHLTVGAGDIVSIPAPSGPTLARVDRVELTTHQMIEAVRITPDVYLPSDFPEETAPLRPFTPAVPVQPFFLDLPLMRGDEVAHAPHIALTADPWPGSVAVYDASQDADYVLNDIIAARSVVGELQSPLFAAPSGRIDRGAAVQVGLYSGQFQSVDEDGLLAGGNLIAVGDGSPDRWEILQFRDAEMIGARTWLLRNRLRGQFGTDGVMPDVWPEGSRVVVLNGALVQIGLAAAQRRQARHFRIGPAKRPIDDPSYVYEVHAFDGIGLRPYRPAHICAEVQATGEDSGKISVSWVRRTRVDGDDWSLSDAPLAEETEVYLLRVSQSGIIMREQQLTVPQWTYSNAMQAADGVSPGYSIDVAQVSARYGPGPFASVIPTP